MIPMLEIKFLIRFLVTICCVILSLSSSASFDENAKKNFGEMIKRLNYNPDDIHTGDRLRKHCREHNENLKCIGALNKLVKSHKKNRILRYQAALAYVDELPGHTIFRKGWLSTRSMNHVSEIIKYDEADWPSYYIRGLNGVYWPLIFRKMSAAIVDLEKCVELTEDMPEGLRKPYNALAFIALGDAHVKNGDVEAGRDVYERGIKIFRSSAKLKSRLEMSSSQLTEYIAEIRHADTRVDTDISLLVTGGSEKI